MGTCSQAAGRGSLQELPQAWPAPGLSSIMCYTGVEAGAAEGHGAESDADDGKWEVAASSHNAARRKRRKQARRAAWKAAAAQRAAQGEHADKKAHHLEGVADGGGSEDWETDGMALCHVWAKHMSFRGQQQYRFFLLQM